MQLDGKRLEIVNLLSKPMTTSEIAKSLDLSKSTVSHHLKILQKLGLVKVEKEEIEKNFIKRYYVSTLHTPEMIFPQEAKILAGFRFTRDEFFRTLIRNLTVYNLENPILLKKVGIDVGYHLLSLKVEVDDVINGIANLWEDLGLGDVRTGSNRIKVYDCYTCSGLDEIGKPYCKLDEGIIEGILFKNTGRRHEVIETKCWGTGDNYCLFEINPL
ncbi:hypothetical protein DRP07_06615 [Archaeoglobales archaeon]|nr:MAG: hypothetical protein DRP07_06615 [Archaeoglobales archaeon]